MLNEVKEYWKKFRGECDELLERDIGGVIAEQIQMTDRILEMFDTIQALRQEINGWESRYAELDVGHSKLFEDFCGLKQESEQLHSQNTAMREALEQARATLQTLNNLGGLGYDKHRWISEALAAIDKIGGREDV